MKNLIAIISMFFCLAMSAQNIIVENYESSNFAFGCENAKVEVSLLDDNGSEIAKAVATFSDGKKKGESDYYNFVEFESFLEYNINASNAGLEGCGVIDIKLYDKCSVCLGRCDREDYVWNKWVQGECCGVVLPDNPSGMPDTIIADSDGNFSFDDVGMNDDTCPTGWTSSFEQCNEELSNNIASINFDNAPLVTGTLSDATISGDAYYQLNCDSAGFQITSSCLNLHIQPAPDYMANVSNVLADIESITVDHSGDNGDATINFEWTSQYLSDGTVVSLDDATVTNGNLGLPYGSGGTATFSNSGSFNDVFCDMGGYIVHFVDVQNDPSMVSGNESTDTVFVDCVSADAVDEGMQGIEDVSDDLTQACTGDLTYSLIYASDVSITVDAMGVVTFPSTLTANNSPYIAEIAAYCDGEIQEVVVVEQEVNSVMTPLSCAPNCDNVTILHSMGAMQIFGNESSFMNYFGNDPIVTQVTTATNILTGMIVYTDNTILGGTAVPFDFSSVNPSGAGNVDYTPYQIRSDWVTASGLNGSAEYTHVWSDGNATFILEGADGIVNDGTCGGDFIGLTENGGSGLYTVVSESFQGEVNGTPVNISSPTNVAYNEGLNSAQGYSTVSYTVTEEDGTPLDYTLNDVVNGIYYEFTATCN